MALNPSNSSNLEQLALKELTGLGRGTGEGRGKESRGRRVEKGKIGEGKRIREKIGRE